MIDNNRKPLFEYSDLELKALGFDLLEIIDNYKNDLTLIRNEITRRKASGVLTSIKENELPNIINKNKSEVKEQSEMVTFDPEEYAGPYKVSSNDESDYKNFESDNSLITPLRKI